MDRASPIDLRPVDPSLPPGRLKAASDELMKNKKAMLLASSQASAFSRPWCSVFDHITPRKTESNGEKQKSTFVHPTRDKHLDSFPLLV